MFFFLNTSKTGLFCAPSTISTEIFGFAGTEQLHTSRPQASFKKRFAIEFNIFRAGNCLRLQIVINYLSYLFVLYYLKVFSLF